MIENLLDQAGQWSLDHTKEMWIALGVYFFFFVIIEMIVHELGHYYFMRKFGIKILFLKIGIGELLARTLDNGTRVIIGVPFMKAEVRSLGELPDEMDQKENPEAFYYRHRHPREHLVTAIAGPLTVLTVCAFICGIYYAIWLIWAVPMSATLVICFGLTIANELFNLLIPMKFGHLGTDAWIAYRALYEWVTRPKIPA